MSEIFELLILNVHSEYSIVTLRQSAKHLASLLGFDNQDQVRIATAVSELARNAFQYARGGQAKFELLQHQQPQALRFTIEDQGPGIQNLNNVLSGNYISQTGMGVGLIGTRKLMDDFFIGAGSNNQGTRVTFDKRRPKGLKDITTQQLKKISEAVQENLKNDNPSEIKLQNQDLLITLQELGESKLALEDLNAELENTNRGVVALYTELDEKASELKKVSQAKTAFLSNMTHEFRAPLNSILNISNILLDPSYEMNSEEMRHQISFVKKSALSLSELVNDLLDLSKIEAGKIKVRKTEFQINDVFMSLKGVMRPLLNSATEVQLIFNEASGNIMMNTDEGKVSQILRNFISNAIKYTDKGIVRVSAEKDQDAVLFSVQDSGVGIAKEFHERIFEEFFQVEMPLQDRHKGTGLGLPLTKRLTELLGGSIVLESTPGVGSIFKARIPMEYHGLDERMYIQEDKKAVASPILTADGEQVCLIVDDSYAERLALGKAMSALGWISHEASSGEMALDLARRVQKIDVIFLDLNMPGMNGFEVIQHLLSREETRKIPVVIHSSRELDDEELKYFESLGTRFLPKFFSEPADRIRAIENLLSEIEFKGR